MSVIAIYAINQHLADLRAEADNERLARLAARPERKPSAIRRVLAAIRSAVGRSTPDATPALAC
jgi:uncharacterized protein with von Willebrand factor type A (vWA) domain